METPQEIVEAQAIRYVDSWQVGDGVKTFSTAVMAALRDAGYTIVMSVEGAARSRADRHAAEGEKQ
jgi:sugar phosphate isomerase/epimerase